MPNIDIFGNVIPDTCDPGPLLRWRDLPFGFRDNCLFCHNYADLHNAPTFNPETATTEHYWLCEDCFPDREAHAEADRERRRERERIAAEAREQQRRERQERQERIAAEACERIKRGERRFGIELEVEINASDHQIANALHRAGVDCDTPGYTHEVFECWKVVSDSSVCSGWEIVSPPMTMERAKREVPIVTETLSNLGAVPADSCGLHVHHEVADLSVDAFKRLVHRWADAQPFIDRMVAPHRRDGNSDWCSSFDRRELQAIDGLTCMSQINNEVYIDRYKSLNVSAFSQYGTVEVRQHQSTLDADEIIAWVAFVQEIIKDAVMRSVNTKVRATDACQLVANVVTDENIKRKLTDKVLAGGGPTGIHSYFRERHEEDDSCPDCGCYECECW